MLLLWSTTISSIGGIILGILVLVKSRKQIGNISFSLVSIILSLEIAANYFSLTNPNSAQYTLFWIRAVMFVVPYLMLSLYYFCSSYLNHSYVFSKKKFFLLLLATISLSIINMTPLSYISVEIGNNGSITPTTGPGLPLNGLHIMPLFGFAIYAMIRNYKKNQNKQEKSMILMSLYTFLISFGVQIITSFVIVAIFNYTRLVPVGNFLTFIFISLMTFSIVYFKAFRINIVGAIFFSVVLAILSLVEVIMARGAQTIAYKLIVFIAVAAIGYALVKSVRKEIEQREKIEKLANDLERANEHLKDLDKLKDDFLSMASHELNTPIAAIIGYLSMILFEKLAGNISAKAKTYLESVYTSAQRLQHMVKDLLNVSRIESGRIHLIWEQKSVEETINQSIMEVMSKAKEAKHTLTFEKPKEAMPKTWYDNNRITEILINMLGNSIKYTDPGGKITVRCVNDDDKIVVSVEDNGRGIPKGQDNIVFDKFSQVTTQDQTKGTGLGMYISKRFIELHKGKIWFHSDGEGKGTTFYFSLPVTKNKPFDPHEGEGEVLH